MIAKSDAVWFWFKYDVRRFFREGIWQKIAFRMPRRVAYWAMIRVVSHAWVQAGTKEPDQITYSEMCEAWMPSRKEV